MCLLNYALCIIILGLIDFPYLYLNRNLYIQKTKAISGRELTSRYYSAGIVYLALALGIVVLVIPRVSINEGIGAIIRDSILYGGVFGIATYATFDFTVHFMFKDWDIITSIMDTLWGAVLCSVTTMCIVLLTK